MIIRESGLPIIHPKGSFVNQTHLDVLRCLLCQKWFKGCFFEPARGEMVWLPCSQCPDILIFYFYTMSFPFVLDEQNQAHADQKRRIEQNLRPCLSCGGQFRYADYSRCPECLQILPDESYEDLFRRERQRPGWRASPLTYNELRRRFWIVTAQTQTYEGDEMVVEKPSRQFLELFANTMLTHPHIKLRYYAACYLGHYAHMGIDELDFGLNEAHMSQLVQEVALWWDANKE